ncbi:DUF362 domain-containing protein [Clostridium sp. CM028]|uniref:DUF362 domain-containing protein n=1 Tax=Clostridium TaxID=1485 RepID=UPI0013EEE6B5|nr:MULTISPECIES: DUF362 domain-containing protein [Clostridium]MBU3093721.1 DUF362 domain-containing protein [Clostridium sp. CF011]MBW9150471.1 DUF362 domain-containing protein [Clostridium sp. CM028]MBZ9609788.1 DUF362 domain-containing protein [Clostridium estertheticum]WAG68913.1 DUF362 domain-containing protein [Clostridium sp. CF011]WLC60680.1 DUF362 domain-containing protein [Clostridium sp. CM028]
MENVALLKCTEYDVDLVEKKLREGFELLGGHQFLKQLIPKNSKVLLKPNMLSVESKGSPVVTHYAVFEAVIRVIREYSSYISFGDSPGFGDSRKAAEKSGLMEVADKYGVTFEDFKESVHIKLDNSILCKSWNISKAAYEADVVISLPKLKTHAMAYYTGAVKNQFGCIPGTQKATWHTRMPDANNFCKMLLDLNTAVGTNFAILDGIIAMEGNGPKSGQPYKMNTLIMGQSLTAVDSTAVRLIGYDDPLDTPVLKEAYDSKWGVVLSKDINILGEDLESMKAKDFKLCRKGGNFYFINPGVTNFLREMIAPNPTLIKEKCIGCGRCAEVCPEKPAAIEMVLKGDILNPKWNMHECIRCFCCQELCPVGAIETKYSKLAKLLKLDKR